MAGGRKDTWETWKSEGVLKDKLLLVEGWARDGLYEEQIYKNLGISRDVFYKLKKSKKELKEVLKRGKEVVDLEVENSLLKKAMGFYYKDVVVSTKREVIYNEGKRIKETSEPILVEVEKYSQPDTTAQIFWLKNRKSKEWRDKQEIEQNTTTEIKVVLEDE